MSIHFNKRKTWFFGRNLGRHITVEIAGFNSTPGIAIDANGSEGEITLSIRCGVAIFLTFAGYVPHKWFAKDVNSYSPSGYTRGDREIEIRFHSWSLWWSFWMKPHEWNAGESKWRRGSIDFDRLFFGKHKCEFTDLEREQHTIYFVEGAYNVEVMKKLREDSWPRWFTRKSIAFEVKAGDYVDGKWIDRPIPVEGKGESAWDCEENATYSSHFPARNLRTTHEAALYFEASMRKNRLKYGGKNWMPQAYRKTA